MSEGVVRRLAAILAADVVGYSRLMEADEEGTHNRLKVCRTEFIEPTVTKFHGRIVNLTGDGALVEFPSVVDAVRCALEVQRGMAARNRDLPENERIVFRIGINLGDVIDDDQDIYGGGVNVAARLEGIAEPGGILISGAAFDQVEGQIDCGFEFIGEQEVKNIERPIRTYRLLLGQAPFGRVGRRRHRRTAWIWIAAFAAISLVFAIGAGLWFHPWRSQGHLAKTETEPFKLPSQPSIAVLPFANLSDDPEQEYFVDGMVNDIITDLSSFSSLFVIAANSTFQYKGKTVDVQEAGRDLGVRYILDGSIQRAANVLRVNAQLVDSTTGTHLWAKRFDREIGDLFAIQNEIAREIVGVIYPLAEGRGRLQRAELDRIGRTPTEDLQAYDYYLQARKHSDLFTRDDNILARELFKKAEELDPAYARAIAGQAWAYLLEYWWSWTESPEAALRQAMDAAQRAIAVDSNEPWAHYALASVYLMKKDHERAIPSFQKAYELNPNDAQLAVEYGWALTLSGRWDEGMRLMDQAVRHNPYHPDWYWVSFAEAYFVADRIDDAIRALEKIPQPWSHVYKLLAANYALAGRLDEASSALKKFQELEPDMTLGPAVDNMPFTSQESYDRFREGLQKAGLAS